MNFRAFESSNQFGLVWTRFLSTVMMFTPFQIIYGPDTSVVCCSYLLSVNCMDMNDNRPRNKVRICRQQWDLSIFRAPNENIVQNHLNIALLNVFYYLNGRYRHIFYPLKFFHLFGCPSLKSSDPKILGIKTYLVENFSQKKGR